MTKVARSRLIDALRREGLRDEVVLSAIDRTPRELFVDREFQELSYADQALPIACGQTISQPYVVGFMTEHLRVSAQHKVLEIGTGSGYQAAVLSWLCAHLYTVERHQPLADAAAGRFKLLKLDNISQLVGDGTLGWPEHAPYDRIIVTAAAKQAPRALLEQLAEGGIMIIPLEDESGAQDLVRFSKSKAGIASEHLLPVRFVPLVEGTAPGGAMT